MNTFWPLCEVLLHVRRTQQACVLANVCCDLETCTADAKDTLIATSRPTGVLHNLTDRAAEVTRLVLEVSRASGDDVDSLARHGGSVTVQWLKKAVYGASSAHASLSELLYSASIEQTKCVKDWCIRVLTYRLSSLESCFIVLEAAVQAGVPSLQEAALNTISTRLSHALTADSAGWQALSQQAVMSILCCDKLQVGSEKDVVEALASWVQAHPQERTHLFDSMFVRAVRVQHMAYTELQEIDGHPLVSQSQQSFMHVAHALLSWHMVAALPLGKRKRTASAEARLQLSEQRAPLHGDSLPLMQPLATDRHKGAHETESSQHYSSSQICSDQQCNESSLELSQHRGMSQPSHHACPCQRQDETGSRAEWEEVHHLPSSSIDSDVELSCSLEESMLAGLDVQSTAVSKLMAHSDRAGQEHMHSYNASTHDSSRSPESCNAPDQSACKAGRRLADGSGNLAAETQQLPLSAVAVTIEAIKGHRNSVQEDMVASPSREHGRRKQARLDSMRCLKF